MGGSTGAVAAAVLGNVAEEVPRDDTGFVACPVCMEPCDAADETIVHWPCGNTPLHCLHHGCVNERTMWNCPVCRGGTLPTDSEVETPIMDQVQPATWPSLPPDGQQRIASKAREPFAPVGWI